MNNVQSVQILSPQLRFTGFYSDKHDRHYATLLQDQDFYQYVISHDMIGTHAPSAEPNRVHAMGEDHIRTLFARIMTNDQDPIITLLREKAVQDGFVILMDDWDQSWIYIHEYANRYEQWEYDGVEEGPRSNQFFL
jgi:hypothetical protein